MTRLPNKGMKLTKPGKPWSFAAYPSVRPTFTGSMSYVIHAIIARETATSGALREGPVVKLPQNLAMLLLTEDVRRRLGLGFCPLTDETESRPPASVMDLLRTISRGSKAAYVEAELFGGVGRQACLLVDVGNIVEPVYTGADAINHALSFLGVVRGESTDEFDAVKLGAHRRTEDWVA